MAANDMVNFVQPDNLDIMSKTLDLMKYDMGICNCVADADDGCNHGNKEEVKAAAVAWEEVDKKFKSIYNQNEQERLEKINQLTSLAKVALTPAQKLDIIFSLIDSYLGPKHRLEFSVVRAQLGTDHISINQWTVSVQNLFVALDILTQYPNIVLTKENDFVVPTEREIMNGAGYNGKIRVRGDLLALVLQICFHFTAILKSLNPHDIEANAERLKGETILIVVLQNVMDYLQRKNNFSEAATAALSLIRRVYYKPQDSYEMMRKLVDQIEFAESTRVTNEEEHCSSPTFVIPQVVPRRPDFPEKCKTLMTQLVAFAKMYGDDDTKSHAVLFQVYHLAVVDDFSNASDLLRRYLNNGAGTMNILTQLHLNRAVAQLGLCAYRSGLIEEAHSFLSELYAHGRVEDLLLQGDITPMHGGRGWIRIRQFPYHVPIDLEHLKVVHMKCCMLQEGKIMNATTQSRDVHFVSNTVCSPRGLTGRTTCGASWERVCDKSFCCAPSSRRVSNFKELVAELQSR